MLIGAFRSMCLKKTRVSTIDAHFL